VERDLGKTVTRHRRDRNNESTVATSALPRIIPSLPATLTPRRGLEGPIVRTPPSSAVEGGIRPRIRTLPVRHGLEIEFRRASGLFFTASVPATPGGNAWSVFRTMSPAPFGGAHGQRASSDGPQVVANAVTAAVAIPGPQMIAAWFGRLNVPLVGSQSCTVWSRASGRTPAGLGPPYFSCAAAWQVAVPRHFCREVSACCRGARVAGVAVEARLCNSFGSAAVL